MFIFSKPLVPSCQDWYGKRSYLIKRLLRLWNQILKNRKCYLWLLSYKRSRNNLGETPPTIFHAMEYNHAFLAGLPIFMNFNCLLSCFIRKFTYIFLEICKLKIIFLTKRDDIVMTLHRASQTGMREGRNYHKTDTSPKFFQ